MFREQNINHREEVFTTTQIKLVINRDGSGVKIMAKQFNPPLHEEPRHQPAPIIPLKQEESLLEWLHNTGRLVSYPGVDYHYEDEEEEEEYVAELVDEFDFQAEELEDLED